MDAFIEVAAANAERLRDRIPWGDDPAYRRERIGGAPVDWEQRRAYLYALRESDDGPVTGEFSLHRRVGPDGLEIGYWLDAAHAGAGLATEVVGVLTGVALALPEVERVEMQTDEGNTRSFTLPGDGRQARPAEGGGSRQARPAETRARQARPAGGTGLEGPGTRKCAEVTSADAARSA